MSPRLRKEYEILTKNGIAVQVNNQEWLVSFASAYATFNATFIIPTDFPTRPPNIFVGAQFNGQPYTNQPKRVKLSNYLPTVKLLVIV